jgi:hypothetical protein
VGGDLLERLASAGGRQHGVALTLESLGNGGPVVLAIVDDQEQGIAPLKRLTLLVFFNHYDLFLPFAFYLNCLNPNTVSLSGGAFAKKKFVYGVRQLAAAFCRYAKFSIIKAAASCRTPRRFARFSETIFP